MRKELGFALVGIVFASVANATSFIIDPFADTQNLTATNNGTVAATDIIGGNRYASITQTTGTNSDTLLFDATPNEMDLNIGNNDTSDMRLLYDGTVNTTGVDAFALGGIDFTQLGTLSLIRINLQSDHLNSLTMKVYTDASNFSTATVNYTAGPFNSYDTPFTAFVATGAGANFASVNAFELTINGVSQQNLQMNLLSAESSSVPEPSTMLLLGGGLVGLGVFSRRRRRS
jgi:PEP-CTERM motif